MKRLFSFLLLVFAVLFVLSACGGEDTGAPESEATDEVEEEDAGEEADEAADQEEGSAEVDASDIVVGTSVPSLEFTFFVAAQKSWEEAAEEMGVEALFFNAEDNQSKQNQ